MSTETNGTRIVCSNSWQGDHGSVVILENHKKHPVTVSQGANCTWPFSDPTSDFTIEAKQGGQPGVYSVTLVDTPGSYCYHTTGCGPGELTNPKTVIIA